MNTKDNFRKFDLQFDVGILFGYSKLSKAYIVYNKGTLVVKESMHATFDKSNHSFMEKFCINDHADE